MKVFNKNGRLEKKKSESQKMRIRRVYQKRLMNFDKKNTKPSQTKLSSFKRNFRILSVSQTTQLIENNFSLKTRQNFIINYIIAKSI